MALFKINRGKFANLPETKTEGYCYVTLDGKQFFFDFLDEEGNLQRSGLNAINADTATALQTARLIDGLSFDGTSDVVGYGTCETEAETVEKVVNCNGFNLVTGSEITVRFNVTNITENPTLNVNGTGGKPIYYRGASIEAGVLSSGRTYLFRYNGEQYEVVGDISVVYGNATETEAGLMSPEDKIKVDAIDIGGLLNEEEKNNLLSHTHSYNDLEDKPFEGDIETSFIQGTVTTDNEKNIKDAYGWGYKLLWISDEILTGDERGLVLTYNSTEYTDYEVNPDFYDTDPEATIIKFDNNRYGITIISIRSIKETYNLGGELPTFNNVNPGTYVYDYSAGEYKLSYKKVNNLVQLDEIFIPDSIARVSDVNKGLNSKAELYHEHDLYNINVYPYINRMYGIDEESNLENIIEKIPGEGLNSTLIESMPAKQVIYGEDKFVALCYEKGSIGFYSEDGITWNQTTLPIEGNWIDITYGNGKFIAIGYDNNSNLTEIYSEDGIIWTNVTLPELDNSGYTIAYGDGKFVIIKRNSDIAFYSEDGITWNQTTLPKSDYWDDMVYGNGKFVAIASGYVIYSEDGITWIESSYIPINTTTTSIAYGNGRFVIVGEYYGEVSYSDDGINWIRVDEATPINCYWSFTTYGNGKFVAIEHSMYGEDDALIYSEDGITWTGSDLPSYQEWQCVAYGDGKFVAVGESDLCTFTIGNALGFAFDDKVVKLSTDQTVNGVKTFKQSPLVPTPITDDQAVNKSYVDEQIADCKLTEDEALAILIDTGVIEPLTAEDGSIYVSVNNEIYVL